jgi:hypothetical protein
MICKEPKWCDRQLKLKNQASGKGDAGTQLKIQFMFNQRQGILLIAAQGQKADRAWRRRDRGIADVGSSTAAVEVLQRINENREKCQEKKDEQMKEILSRKDGKLYLQKELVVMQMNGFELRKQHIEIKKHHNLARMIELKLSRLRPLWGAYSRQGRISHILDDHVVKYNTCSHDWIEISLFP